MSPEEAERAIDELALEAATLLGDGTHGVTSPPASAAGARDSGNRPRFWLAICIAVMVPLVSFGVYRHLGQPDVAADPSLARGIQGEEDLEQAVAAIEARLREAPDDGEAWAMLGEARRLQNRFDDAVTALRNAQQRLPRDARVAAELAEALVAQRGGDFSGEPVALLEQALAHDPRAPKALALMGAAQFRLGRNDAAIGYLQRLIAELPEGSEQSQQIAAVIARIRQDGTGAASANAPSANAPSANAPSANAPSTNAPLTRAAPANTAKTPPAPTSTANAIGPSIAGSVRLSPSLQAKVPAGATLFVVARAPDGPRIPYAVLRQTAGAFPFAFTLSDAQAMDPGRPLSGAPSVVIEARISASGNAMRQPGDLIGTSAPVAPGARDVTIEIGRVVE